MPAPVAVGPPSFDLHSGGKFYPLSPGASFRAMPFGMFLDPAPSDTYAGVLVVADPDDPSQLALENRTSGTWAVRMPDGTGRQVLPGQTLRLAERVRIEVSKAHTMCVDTFSAGGGLSYTVEAAHCDIVRVAPEAAGTEAAVGESSSSAVKKGTDMSHPSFSGVPTFELLCQGRPFPLAYGASFTRNEFPMLAPASGAGPVAQVSANPNDPTQLGLQNLTSQPWGVLMPDGSQQQVEPGRSVRLMDGVTLQMGGVQCQIRAAQATGTGAFTPPAFGQPQAPQFGQQQAPQFGQQPASPFGQQPPQNQGGFTPPAFGQPQQTPFGQPQAQAGGAWPPPPADGAAGGWNMNAGANDSGTGKTAMVPPQLKGFNAGAFFLNWIWAIGNKSYIGLLALIPYVGFVVAIWLGVKGNEMAWQNRRWDSVEQFQATQKVWAGWGLALFVIGVVGQIGLYIMRSHMPQQ